MMASSSTEPPSLQDLSAVAILILLVTQSGDNEEALPFEALKDFDSGAASFLLSLFESCKPRLSGPYSAFYGSSALKSLDLRSFDEAQRTDLLKDLCYGAAPHLSELCMGRQVLNDRQLRLLAESCPSLEELVLVECRGFSDAAFQGLTALNTLFLRHCAVEPLGETLGRQLGNVRVLDLANTPTTRSFWDALLEQEEISLEELYADNIGACIPSPKEPCLGAEDVCDVLVTALQRVRALCARHLEAPMESVFIGLAHASLPNLANLVEADFSYSDFDDQCLHAFLLGASQRVNTMAESASLALKRLKLRETRIKSAGVRALSDHAALLENLETLDIGRTLLSEGATASAIGEKLNLGALVGLRELVMDQIHVNVDWTQTEGSLAFDLGLSLCLRSLSVSFVRAFERDTLAISIGGPDPFDLGMGPPAFEKLLMSGSLPSTLRELIWKRPVMPGREIWSMIRSLRKLRALVLDHAHNLFGDEEFEAVLQLPKLKKLSIVNTAVTAKTLQGYIFENPFGRRLEELYCGYLEQSDLTRIVPLYSCISRTVAEKLMSVVAERHWKGQWARRVCSRDLDKLWQQRSGDHRPARISTEGRWQTISLSGQSRELYRQAAMLRRASRRRPLLKKGYKEGEGHEALVGTPARIMDVGEKPALVQYTHDELMNLREGAANHTLSRETQARILRVLSATKATGAPPAAWRSSRPTRGAAEEASGAESRWRK